MRIIWPQDAKLAYGLLCLFSSLFQIVFHLTLSFTFSYNISIGPVERVCPQVRHHAPDNGAKQVDPIIGNLPDAAPRPNVIA